MAKFKTSIISGDLPLDSPRRRRLPPLLRRAWYGLNQAFRRRIAHLQITPDQFTILRTLTEGSADGCTQRELAAIMTSDPNTMSSLLKRMEAAGLIERRAHESDRRAHRICLRPEGQRVFVAARQAALDLQAEVLDAIPRDRREEFLEHLETIAEACRKAAGLEEHKCPPAAHGTKACR